MSEYDAYWLKDFPVLIVRHAPRNNDGDMIMGS